MSRSQSPHSPGTPHLVSLVLHSKKALQHGEQLCSYAHELTHATSGLATDVLALNAKVCWVSEGILEQLRVVDNVAKTIEMQRNRLEEQAKEWDRARSFHSGNLDNILESLESQVVPPDFHLSSSSSSLFGGRGSSDAEESGEGGYTANRDMTERNSRSRRSKWKTLRDFVDFASIAKATEDMDDDRDLLEDISCKTEGFSLSLNESVIALRAALPTEPNNTHSIKDVFASQEKSTLNMANHLEGLASHYEQMRAALEDKEAGVELHGEDLAVVNKDTDELPSVVAELEDDVALIKASHDQLFSAMEDGVTRLNKLREIVSKLDELEGVMSDMLTQQQDVEVEYEAQLEVLHHHLTNLEQLCNSMIEYEKSFNSLLIELERRRRYRDAAEEIVRGMARQLDAMRNEEIQLREAFFAEHGPHLPDDLCLCVGNMPTTWEVGPASGEIHEELPSIDEDLIVEATRKIDIVKDGTDSV